jgi:hypothetical protein
MESAILKQPEPQRACLLALRDIILTSHPDVSGTTKYGMPCFLINKRILCYLWVDKKTTEPYVLFADGNKMDHLALEQGDRARMKIWRVDPEQDIDVKLIDELLKIVTRVIKPH